MVQGNTIVVYSLVYSLLGTLHQEIESEGTQPDDPPSACAIPCLSAHGDKAKWEIAALVIALETPQARLVCSCACPSCNQ